MANRLELTWVGKENRPRVEPRVLLEDASKSFHAPKKVSEKDFYDNRLIFGDNLLGLKALEQEFAGKIRCVFIDPPYNTGSAFEHYEDGLEHSIWLSMMRDRLEIIRRLISDDGSLWITIDDNEAHYLKVLCDEIFGRNEFVANVIWQKKFSPQNDAKWLSDMHDHVLVYAKKRDVWLPNRLIASSKASANRRNMDNDPRGPWISVDYTSNKNRQERPNLWYPITNPNTGRVIWPKQNATWRFSQERHAQNESNRFVYWGKDGRNEVPRFKNFGALEKQGQVPTTLWYYEEVGSTQEARKESLTFNPSEPFSTPKPERLLERIIQLSTNVGDIVLDSFAGSGTTGAVAHKMGRRWIMVELGEHCHTHIIPRMQKVIDGSDQGGISEAMSWKGGGGFRYYRLAPSLLAKDDYGNWVVNKQYNAAVLAEAVCKLEGYRYAPSSEAYWQHGHSSEDSFIYVTTQTLLVEQLRRLNAEVGPKRSLLICCGAFTAKNLSDFPRLTVKKIPKAVLHRCEWGHDDYSLEIRNMQSSPAATPPAQPPNGDGSMESRRHTVTLLSYRET
ncbi:MAG: site-specific DNA-methyltransferase [Nitrososphaerota archaeon]|nr:site-specific DNA-methyltransferase [Nitrososphaerota archaeon]